MFLSCFGHHCLKWNYFNVLIFTPRTSCQQVSLSTSEIYANSLNVQCKYLAFFPFVSLFVLTLILWFFFWCWWLAIVRQTLYPELKPQSLQIRYIFFLFRFLVATLEMQTLSTQILSFPSAAHTSVYLSLIFPISSYEIRGMKVATRFMYKINNKNVLTAVPHSVNCGKIYHSSFSSLIGKIVFFQSHKWKSQCLPYFLFYFYSLDLARNA